MQKKYVNLFLAQPKQQSHAIKNFKLRFCFNFFRSIVTSLYVFIIGGCGINFHWFIVKKALKAFIQKKINLVEFSGLAIAPLDSVRYFEFYYGNLLVQQLPKSNFLDISSPRFFPAFLIDKYKIANPFLLNPDVKDIEETKTIFQKLSLGGKAPLINKLIQDANFEPASFDLVTSISVLEHIPLQYIDGIITDMTRLIKPNGYFLVSVPIAKESFEEYIDYNEYGLQNTSADGYYFGQRFHSEQLINDIFFKKLGQPVQQKFLTEKQEGYFVKNRFEKINYINYPSWKEAYLFNNNFKIVSKHNQINGLGIGMYLFKINSKA